MKSIVLKILPFALTACAYSCTGQSAQEDNCKLHYGNAKKDLNLYYKSGDSSALLAALNEAEPAFHCPSTRPSAVILKITVLQQLKRNEQGCRFIDSLSAADFKPQYLKDVYYDLFKALHFESVGDTAMRDKIYTAAAAELLDSIKKEGFSLSRIDEEAYAHYLFFRSKLLTKEQTGSVIDSIFGQYKIDKDFFDAMHFQFDDTSKPVPPRVKH
jgi:hypothetical protein